MIFQYLMLLVQSYHRFDDLTRPLTSVCRHIPSLWRIFPSGSGNTSHRSLDPSGCGWQCSQTDPEIELTYNQNRQISSIHQLNDINQQQGMPLPARLEPRFVDHPSSTQPLGQGNPPPQIGVVYCGCITMILEASYNIMAINACISHSACVILHWPVNNCNLLQDITHSSTNSMCTFLLLLKDQTIASRSRP